MLLVLKYGWYLKATNKNRLIASSKWMTTSRSPKITLCYIPYIQTFIYLTRFHYVPILNGFISLVRVNAITWVHSLTCVFNFNLCLVCNLLGVTYKCYVGQRFGYYKRFLLARIILFKMFFMCDWLDVIYECFAYANTLYEPVQSKWVTYVLKSTIV